MRTFDPYQCPEVRALYEQTIARACERSFLGYTTSSQQESIDQINNVFWAAASVNEAAEGRAAPDEGRALDLAEARLAIAALNVASGERLIAANEGRAAYDRLQETIGSVIAATYLRQNPAEVLMSQCSSRGRGWRRIRNEAIQGDIRANFRSERVTSIDSRPGLNPADAVFAAYTYNFQVGGSDETIGYSDAWAASATIEYAARGLTTYYSI